MRPHQSPAMCLRRVAALFCMTLIATVRLAAADAPSVGDVVDLSPASPPGWTPKYVIAPLISLVRGRAFVYEQRSVQIDTTPSGGVVDLFYVRSGFQKRFEQAKAPITLMLPSRLETGPRDALMIRAFADGYQQESVTYRVKNDIGDLLIDLEPLPNTLEGIRHRYFFGRSSVGFLTKEALTFRLQEANDGIAVILTQTALSETARDSVAQIRSPLIDEGYSQQLGQDLMVKVMLTELGRGDETEVRSRQSYHAPRDLYEFTIDFVPSDGGRESVARTHAALASVSENEVSGCALAFDDMLRSQISPGDLARALSPAGSFTDPYLRAAMRRLGEVSVDGVVDFVDGAQYRPDVPIELEMSLSKASEAKGYLALLRSFVSLLEIDESARSEALRSLVAPEAATQAFASIMQRALGAETSCRSAG